MTTQPHDHINNTDQLDLEARLTAYLLDELDEAQRADIDAKLQTDPALQQELEATRHTIDMVRAEFAREPGETLTEQQRQDIETHAAQADQDADDAPPVIFTFRRVWMSSALAVAAIVALVLAIPIIIQTEDGKIGDDQVASDMPNARGVIPERETLGAPSGGLAARGGGRGSGTTTTEGDMLFYNGRENGQAPDQSIALGAPADPNAVAERLADIPADMYYAWQDGSKQAQPDSRRDSRDGTTRGEKIAATANEPQSATATRGAPPVQPSTPPPPPPPLSSLSTVVEPTASPAPQRDARQAGLRPLMEVDAQVSENVEVLTADVREFIREMNLGDRRQERSRNIPLRFSLGRSNPAQLDEIDPSERPDLTRAIQDLNGEITVDLKQLATAVDTRGAISDDEAVILRRRIRSLNPDKSELELRDDLDSIRLGLQVAEDFNREAYAPIHENPFIAAAQQPLSTLSIDVDTASYTNVRRMIEAGQLPPADAVRIEEFLNYFTYDDAPPAPDAEDPFNVTVESGPCPWQTDHRLVRIGLKARAIDHDMRPATNLVFLLDVSGSMNQPNKLPLVKESMRMLLKNLTPDDRVAIVVYAGAAGLVMDSTFVYQREAILDAIARLSAGGSTAGSAGIQLAYKVAQDHFIDGGVNRVILCTDGDFNVGVSSDGALVNLIEEKRQSGVFLSVLGFGTGNWQDAKMEAISNAGNGNFAYIDSLDEAHRVLVEEMGGTLVTVAKDLKLQVDFNPNKVNAYRLIGYENRVLAAQDFADDTKDAGEVGAGHSLTALFEVVPVGVDIDLPGVEPSKYVIAAGTPPVNDADAEAEALGHESPRAGSETALSTDTIDETDETPADVDPASTTVAGEPSATEAVMNELLEVRLRYKQPDADVSVLRTYPHVPDDRALSDTSDDFRFAAGVASFGMMLRHSRYQGDSSYDLVRDLVRSASGAQAGEYLTAMIRYAAAGEWDLARANAQALDRLNLADAQFTALLHRTSIDADALDAALADMADASLGIDPAPVLTAMLQRAKAGIVDKSENTYPHPVTTQRRNFLKIVEKASAIPVR
jgi:Ca-activated chloride channel family protein